MHKRSGERMPCATGAVCASLAVRAQWTPTRQGYLLFLAESKAVYDALEQAVLSEQHPECESFAARARPTVGTELSCMRAAPPAALRCPSRQGTGSLAMRFATHSPAWLSKRATWVCLSLRRACAWLGVPPAADAKLRNTGLERAAALAKDLALFEKEYGMTVPQVQVRRGQPAARRCMMRRARSLASFLVSSMHSARGMAAQR